MIRITELDRFRSRIATVDACFMWTGITRRGYPMLWTGAKLVSATRWAYEYWIAKIEPRTPIYRTCGNRLCVNPQHLMPACKFGHMYTENNIYRKPDGSRCCKLCKHSRY